MPVALRLRDLLRREERQYAGQIVLAALIGVLGAVGNLVFRTAIEAAAWLFQGQAARAGRVGIPLAMLAGGVVLLVLDRVFPGEVLGYGFPRFLEMLHLQGARVKRRWMIVKTLGAAISLGSGAAVGREGPIAQIGGSIAGAVAWLVQLSTEQRKVLIGCGAAAGVAATFNAPLGALMFAQEIVLLGEVTLANTSLTVVATVASVIASRGLLGNEPAFRVPLFVFESYWECLTYGMLGILLGLLAVVYIRLFHTVAARARSLQLPRAVVLLGGLSLVGLIGMVFPENVSDGYDVIDRALAGELGWGLMAMLALAKVVASSLSLGCGAPGGVFGPVLFIGAMGGGSFHAVSDYLLPGLTGPRGSYAVVGLGAFLAATTHAPLTAMFLLFEMTQSYAVAVPALVTAGIALIVASRLQPDSIDTLGLTAEGKSLHAHPERLVLERIPVGNVYQRDVETIPERAPLPDILRVVGQSRRGTFPVVDDDGRLAGVLSFAGLRSILLEDSLGALIVARDLCDPHVPTLTPESTLAEAFRRVEADGLEDVPVVDPADPRRLLGMLSRADLIGAYNRTVATLGALPMSAWLGAAASQPSDAYRVLVVSVPRSWVGQTLRQIDCRRRYGITVLAVHPAGHDEPAYAVPDPERPLASGDRLVLAGTSDGLRQARVG